MGDLSEGRSITLEGSEQGFALTRVDALLGWARKYSLFMYPFVTACCGMEFMSLQSPRFDLARFGAEAPRFSPRQADLLWVVGTISQRQAPVLKRIYEQMMEPKWVLAFGTCASSGGFYDNYTTIPGIDKVIPCDVYIPGCPPRPEAVLDGLMLLQDKIARNERRPGVVKPRSDPPEQVAELVRLRRSAHDPAELRGRGGRGQGGA
jgi:NADH-quinone oxidoreductase subunit B